MKSKKRVKLTKRLIDSFKYEGKNNSRDVRWDEEVPKFGLRIYPSGKKAFIILYPVSGRDRFMTLGEYGALTLTQARDMAREKIVDVIKGKDPLEEKKKENQGDSVLDLSKAYMERHAKARKKESSWKDDLRRIERHILPAWRNRKAKGITRADVAGLHSKIGKGAPYEANRVLALLSKMFELAQRWGFVPEGHPNPAHGIDKFREEKRDRWVTPEELPRLAQAIDREGNIYARAALCLYLLTGTRKSEILCARWEDVDFDRAELRIPDTKARRIHYVPLSTPALELLRKIPRVDGNPHILPGKVEGHHLVNIDKAWRRVRKAAGVDDVRLHDLRRTVGSWLAQAGNSLHLIGRVLNHSNTSTTAIYARFGQDQVREALEQHAQRIMGVANKNQGAEVVTLNK
jgi:integrase